MSMTVKERERKLRVKRRDWKFGRFGWGVSFHPFIPLGAAFAVKWWPCEQAIALQASLCMVQGYVYVSVR